MTARVTVCGGCSKAPINFAQLRQLVTGQPPPATAQPQTATARSSPLYTPSRCLQSPQNNHTRWILVRNGQSAGKTNGEQRAIRLYMRQPPEPCHNGFCFESVWPPHPLASPVLTCPPCSSQPDEKKESKKKSTTAAANSAKKKPDTGSWPCKMDGCKKVFAREADLKRHQRTTKTHSVPGLYVSFPSSGPYARTLNSVRDAQPMSAMRCYFHSSAFMLSTSLA